MADRRDRHQKRRHFNWFFIILACMVLAGGYRLYQQQVVLTEVNHNKSQAQAELQKAQKQQQELQQEQEQLNDPAYIEKLAREKLGMTKQGEIPYVYNRKQ